MRNYNLIIEAKMSAKSKADSEGKVWETMVGKHLNNGNFPEDHREKGKSPEQVHHKHATALFGRNYQKHPTYLKMNDAAKEAATHVASRVGKTNRVAWTSQEKDHEAETGVKDRLSKADLIVTKGAKKTAISLKHGVAGRATNYGNPGVKSIESHSGVSVSPHTTTHYKFMQKHKIANLSHDEYKNHPKKELIDSSNDHMMKNIAKDYAHGLVNKLHHSNQNKQDENIKNHIKRTIGAMGHVKGGDEAAGKTHLQHIVVKSQKDKKGNYTHTAMDSEEHANNYLSHFHNLHVETAPHENGKPGQKSVTIYGTHKGTGKKMKIHQQSFYSGGRNHTLAVRGAVRLSAEHKVDATKPFNSSTVSEARETPLQRAKRSPDAGVQKPKLLDRVKSKLKDKLGIKEESLDEKCWDGYKRVPGTKKNAPGSCEKIKEEKDACYHKVKSRYKVWPSAYASGALSKCRKVGAKNWGTQKEETKITGTNCANCIWWKKESEKPVDKDELNENGGLKPTSEAYIEMAKHVDLISLPGKATVKVKAFCAHEDVQDFVTERMCCAYWDNKDAARDFEGKADVMDENVTPIVAEDLRKWFRERWVRFGPDGEIRGDCARGSESEGKPKCLPAADAAALGKKGRAQAARRKRREDPNPERKGKAIMVKTVKEDTITEALDYHMKNKVPFCENIFRPGSDSFFELLREAKVLYQQGQYTPVDGYEQDLLESDIGEFAEYEGRLVPLDFPFELDEASDLTCPNCGANHGKDRENPKDKTCNQCGHKFKNIHGFTSETDNDAEAAAWLKRFNQKNVRENLLKKMFGGGKPRTSDMLTDAPAPSPTVGKDLTFQSNREKYVDKNNKLKVDPIVSPTRIKEDLIPEEAKPYVSKLGKQWQVLDHEGKVVFSHPDRNNAIAHLKTNYDKYRHPKHTNIGEDLESHWKTRAAKFHKSGEESLAKKDYPTATKQFTVADRIRSRLIDRGMAGIRKNLEDMRKMRAGEHVTEEDKTGGKGIGKPFRKNGGGAVYVRSGDGVRLVNFSQSGMTKKFNDPGALKSFMARHHCLTNKDKTSASYWACRWPRYFSNSGKKWW